MRFTRTATAAIALVTIGVWVLISVIDEGDRATILMGVIPARLSGLVDLAPAVWAWLTPLSATLVHAGFAHLALNMIVLLWCGTMIERMLGGRSLVLLYVVGAYAAAIAQWLVDPVSIVPMVGASGGISAVIGAYALSFGQQKRLVRSDRLNRVLNALWLLAAWVALQLLVGLVAGSEGILLATPAHIGGFVAGLLLQRPLLMWRYRSA